jgi:hypothetical protein
MLTVREFLTLLAFDVHDLHPVQHSRETQFTLTNYGYKCYKQP